MLIISKSQSREAKNAFATNFHIPAGQVQPDVQRMVADELEGFVGLRASHNALSEPHNFKVSLLGYLKVFQFKIRFENVPSLHQ